MSNIMVAMSEGWDPSLCCYVTAVLHLIPEKQNCISYVNAFPGFTQRVEPFRLRAPEESASLQSAHVDRFIQPLEVGLEQDLGSKEPGNVV